MRLQLRPWLWHQCPPALRRCAVASGTVASGTVACGTAPEVLGMGIFGTLIDMIIDYGVQEIGGKCGMEADLDGGG